MSMGGSRQPPRVPRHAGQVHLQHTCRVAPAERRACVELAHLVAEPNARRRSVVQRYESEWLPDRLAERAHVELALVVVFAAASQRRQRCGYAPVPMLS